jgi:hypothetical protein
MGTCLRQVHNAAPLHAQNPRRGAAGYFLVHTAHFHAPVRARLKLSRAAAVSRSNGADVLRQAGVMPARFGD